MSINIGIAVDTVTYAMRVEPQTCLRDDGYYWFLHPQWGALYERTRQYIDLYGFAAFAGEDLIALRETIAQCAALVSAQAQEEWPVQIGVRQASSAAKSDTPVISTVNKAEYLRLLGELDAIANQAMGDGARMILFGD